MTMLDITLKGKQVELFTLMSDKERNSCFVVSIRSGKTFLCFLQMVIEAQNNPGSVIAYFCPTYKMLSDIMWKEYIHLLREAEGTQIKTINESDKLVEFTNGSRIIMRSTDHPERIRGLTLDLAILDEAAIMKREVIYEIQNRLTATPGRERGRMIIISSPNGRNHFYDFIYGNQGEPGIMNSEYWHYRRYNAEEMGVIVSEEIEVLKRNKSSASFQQDVMVEFSNVEGRVYKSFNETNHIKNIGIDWSKPLWVGVDFNISRLSAGCAQIMNGNKLVWVDEIMIENAGTKELADAIAQRWAQPRMINGQIVNPKLYVCPDAAGNQRKTSADYGITDIYILKNTLSRYRADFKYGSTNPSIKDTVNAVNLLIENDRMYVSPKCKEIIKTMINLVYRPGTSDILKDNVYDHFGDLIRYVVQNTFPLKEDVEIRQPTRRMTGAYL
jgi:phage terminase large subunit